MSSIIQNQMKTWYNTGRTHFKKYHTPWNKGVVGYHTKPCSEERKIKIGNANRGKSNPSKGKPRPPEVIAKIKANQPDRHGSIPWNKGKKGLQISWNKGKTLSESHKTKLKIARSRQITPLKDTKIELKIQELLTSLNIKFRKHITTYHPKMGYHQVDIMIDDHEGNPKIAIECDGCYWHGCPEHYPNNNNRREKDRLINTCLIELGIKVIRLWEHDIYKNNINLNTAQIDFSDVA